MSQAGASDVPASAPWRTKSGYLDQCMSQIALPIALFWVTPCPTDKLPREGAVAVKMQVYRFALDDSRWRVFVGPVRDLREAEAVLRSMFGARLRAVEAAQAALGRGDHPLIKNQRIKGRVRA